MKYQHILLLVAITAGLLACGDTARSEHAERANLNPTATELSALPWDSLLTAARGAELTLMMWQGDPQINAFMADYVVPELKARFDIRLSIAPGQGNQIVSALRTEQQAGVQESELDLVWINGETFYQLRELNALYGPFTDALPNSAYVNTADPFIGIDFQQAVEGYECPWGNVQFCLIYNSEHIAEPPANRVELEQWVRANPGKFTIPTDFAGMTFLKSLLVEIAGDKTAFHGPFNEAKYNAASEELWVYLNRLKPYLWKEGKTFPATVAPMHQLFRNGELYFTMSNNDGEVENKVANGTLPEASRGYVFNAGSIRNAHYLGITAQSANKAAAVVAINFLISPEAQLKKADPSVWGDGTVLDVKRLPNTWPAEFEKFQDRNYAPNRSQLDSCAIMEPAPDLMIRLYNDFRQRIVEA